ncbi:chemotaxis protein CheX [Dactylosporangium sp. AC04546]|uniref:chemotaxis protein CheX n=1 Tax=Dactylosporangium sp. AC04546 TaxID=2862460 RepID=UPI001EDFDD0F|nr:chemotaxis protein CheX [Dactylosporangium sp. AC04546]WVK80138.1 chemotaxis protein CheX [Dactylosporangium sp. AC04546]
MDRPTVVADATITADDLHGIIWQVWTAYLGTTPTTPPGKPPAGRAELTASVCIAGAWLGHVVLRAGLPAAGAIAAAMLELDPAGVKPEDVQDAAGELMNIVTGNVKSLLPQPSHVALPQVVVGAADVLWPGTEPVCSVPVAWDDHVVTIEVLRGTPNP